MMHTVKKNKIQQPISISSNQWNVDGCASISTSALEGLPIDFYNPNWFNYRTAGQKRIVADSNSIEFLPDATKSLLGKQHQVNDDELGDSLTEESDQLAYLEENVQKENPIDEAKEESGELEYLIDQDVGMEDAENNNIGQHQIEIFSTFPINGPHENI
ncbi:hypothetical protein O181_049687 [Austropuccinia psidii MF-1]|uniref:Uncharacterized protein n=1 Tax=Austropuccinia psidii MF-1 TaxID=1389203 RepID=A0A9Q3E290_9BASI|nr:hypothetical protein [Austropuccinia psidii MF-1]